MAIDVSSRQGMILPSVLFQPPLVGLPEERP